MIGWIYLIRNKINGKGYIGQTIQPVFKRFSLHLSRAKTGKAQPLYHAMRKHGIENFEVIEIVSCDAIRLNDLEKYFVNTFGTLISKHGYNLTFGGNSNFRMSDETRSKMALAKLGKKRGPHSPEHKNNLSKSAKRRGQRPLSRTGSRHSEVTKAKIAVALRKSLSQNTNTRYVKGRKS